MILCLGQLWYLAMGEKRSVGLEEEAQAKVTNFPFSPFSKHRTLEIVKNQWLPALSRQWDK